MKDEVKINNSNGVIETTSSNTYESYCAFVNKLERGSIKIEEWSAYHIGTAAGTGARWLGGTPESWTYIKSYKSADRGATKVTTRYDAPDGTYHLDWGEWVVLNGHKVYNREEHDRRAKTFLLVENTEVFDLIEGLEEGEKFEMKGRWPKSGKITRILRFPGGSEKRTTWFSVGMSGGAYGDSAMAVGLQNGEYSVFYNPNWSYLVTLEDVAHLVD